MPGRPRSPRAQLPGSQHRPHLLSQTPPCRACSLALSPADLLPPGQHPGRGRSNGKGADGARRCQPPSHAQAPEQATSTTKAVSEVPQTACSPGHPPGDAEGPRHPGWGPRTPREEPRHRATGPGPAERTSPDTSRPPGAAVPASSTQRHHSPPKHALCTHACLGLLARPPLAPSWARQPRTWTRWGWETKGQARSQERLSLGRASALGTGTAWGSGGHGVYSVHTGF